MNWASVDRWMAGALLLIASGTALAFVPTMRQATTGVPATHEVHFHGAPSWAGDTLLQHLAEAALGADTTNGACVDRGALCAIRETLDETGWFASVDQVRRSSTGALIVQATFLAPTAIVEDRYGEAIVDAQGRLLPEGCRLSSDAHVIRIVNPRRHRPVRARRAWESEDVHAALLLLNHIRDEDWINQIHSIDLSDGVRNGHLVLVTDRQSRIVWGSSPGTETPLEAIAERKLVRLDHLFRNSGRVDQHHTGEIDLTDASVVVRR